MASEARGAGDVNSPGAAGASAGPRQSLSDEVHARLLELLVAADLAPGAPLRIDTLARRWRVSPTPVREALARAEASGLVTREPMRGYRVAPLLSPAEFDHLVELRLLIEPHCAARASVRLSAPELEALARHHDVMRAAPTGPTSVDYGAYLRADIAFHEGIVAGARNRFLQAALAVPSTHAHRFRRFSGGAVADAAESLVEHAAVLEALTDRDPAAAEAAMRRHLRGVEARGREVVGD